MDFLKNREEDVVFCQVFLLSPLHCTLIHCRYCKRLREFRKREISQAIELTLNSKRKTLKAFV